MGGRPYKKSEAVVAQYPAVGLPGKVSWTQLSEHRWSKSKGCVWPHGAHGPAGVRHVFGSWPHICSDGP